MEQASIEKSHYTLYSDGRIINEKTGRVLKPFTSREYISYNIMLDGVCRYFEIHRLLARYFVHNPNPKKRIQVNHKDLNKHNNDLDNLEWVTPEQNIHHAMINGIRRETTIFKSPVIDLEIASQILDDRKSGLSMPELSRKYNVSVGTIFRVIHSIHTLQRK